MGIYLNPGAAMLRQARNSKIYVDKSGLIAYLNGIVNTEQLYVCSCRPRWFGKTMGANMVAAYYDRTVDGAKEFEGLQIASDPSFDAERNRYDVVKVNMQDFLSATEDVGELLDMFQRALIGELVNEYPEFGLFDTRRLPFVMSSLFNATQRQFVIVMGEWANSTADEGWAEVARSIRDSEGLLEALIAERADEVAAGVERAHEDSASIIAYNDENALACTLRLAFFSAVRRYKLIREAPAGKGYADLVMVPLKSAGAVPGVAVELKWDATPADAVAQVRERGYGRFFRGTSAENDIIICGIAYDPKSKTHSCSIKRA